MLNPKLNKYRLKLPQEAIEYTFQSSVHTNKFEDLWLKANRNFLINYYADPLFTKVSRLNIQELTNILRKTDKEILVKNKSVEMIRRRQEFEDLVVNFNWFDE